MKLIIEVEHGDIEGIEKAICSLGELLPKEPVVNVGTTGHIDHDQPTPNPEVDTGRHLTGNGWAPNEPTPEQRVDMDGNPVTLPSARQEPVDTTGLPWDKRIHSSGKTTNKDGTWKLKKGVDKALVEQVKYELTGPAAFTQSEDPNPFNEPPVHVPEAAEPTSQVQPDSTVSLSGTTWISFLDRMNVQVREGTFDKNKADQLLQANGVKNIPLLEHRPDLWDTFLTSLGA